MKKIICISFLYLNVGILIAQTITEREKVIATVEKSAIEGHIYFLADDLLKGRETGTSEAKIAASYLANTLHSYGVKPIPGTATYLQEVRLQKSSPPKEIKISLNQIAFQNKVALKAGQVDYNGDVIYLEYGLEEDYIGKNVENKVVIIKAGNAKANDARAAFRLWKEKAAIAEKAGAIAVIELMDVEPRIWGFMEHNFNGDRLEVSSKTDKNNENSAFSYVWLQDENGTISNSFKLKRNNTVQLSMDATLKSNIISQNVIGIVEGTDALLKEEYIIYSAHYDHVGIGSPDETGDTIYNGARDNAVGTTTVLSMAQNLAKYPTKRSALFILFTGEEKGLLGSSFYVENPVLPLQKMVYCFNSDNAGYNDTTVATIIGLERTTASQHIKDAAMAFGITAIDDPAPEQGLFDRSDNVHFAKKGIPSPTYSLGFRSFDGDVTKYYHKAGDEANTLDYDYLEKFFRSYVLAGRLIANDPKTSVWAAGDSYEATGKKLYGN